jgi:C4-dicarboxylate transporter DctM subunit
VDFLTWGIICVFMLLFLLVLGLNIGLSFILSGFITTSVILGTDSALSFLGQAGYSSIARPTWAAVPLFTLMGAFCSVGGLAFLAYKSAFVLTRGIPGSLWIATTISSGIFGAISGSSLATAAMFGRIALPELQRYGYNKRLSVGVIASAGTFATMIPPSVLMIIYALFTRESIAKLFAAGVVPGILTIVAYCILILVMIKRRPEIAPKSSKIGEEELVSRIRALVDMWPIIVIAGVVLGGLYGGFFTPTEAAAAGAAISLILALSLGYMTKLSEFNASLNQTARVTAMIFLLTIGALYYSQVMAITGVPVAFTKFLLSFDLPPLAILVIICFVIFILGMLMVPVGIYALTLPIFIPLVKDLGYDPIWFGIISIKLIEIGAVTPPVGLNVFAIKGVIPSNFNITMGDIYAGCVPFVLVDLIVLALLIAFPAIVMWLPNIMIN